MTGLPVCEERADESLRSFHALFPRTRGLSVVHVGAQPAAGLSPSGERSAVALPGARSSPRAGVLAMSPTSSCAPPATSSARRISTAELLMPEPLVRVSGRAQSRALTSPVWFAVSENARSWRLYISPLVTLSAAS
jgi:hypothetical protein